MQEFKYDTEKSVLDVPEVPMEAVDKACREAMALLERHGISQFIIVAKGVDGHMTLISGCTKFMADACDDLKKHVVKNTLEGLLETFKKKESM